MQDLSYVRTEMVPEQEPPASAVGLFGWMRANLFSGPRDIILTLVSLYVIYAIGSEVLAWSLQDTWGATSLRECREIIAARLGRTRMGPAGG